MYNGPVEPGRRYKNWKYIPARRNIEQLEQLYNLELDVAEQNNVIEQSPEIAQHMRDILEKTLNADAMYVFE